VDTLKEIRQVAVNLASGAKLEAGTCHDWTEEHLKLARSHSLGPWLYKSFRDNPQADLNAEILEGLHHDYRSSVVAYLLRNASLVRLLDAFSERRLPVLLLKGAYLGRFVYKDPALRPMSDVDILVRDEDFLLAGQQLVALGYNFVEEPDSRYHRFLKMPVAYFKPGDPFDIIDLHCAVRSMDYYLFSCSSLWSQATEEDIQGRRAFYLTPEMNFIHLAVHNLNHVGLLRDWVDLVLLLRQPELDWERLLRCARSVGALRPLFWIFRELEDTWHFRPPGVVNSELSRYRPRWLEDRVIDHRFRYFWRLVSRVISFEGWPTRLRYLRLKLSASAGGGTPSRETPQRIAHLRKKLGLFLHFWNRG
jgi:hypothetical protein